MSIDFGVLIWTIINILGLILIVYFLYRAYRNMVKRVEKLLIQQETIINKLDEVIELNKNGTEIPKNGKEQQR